VSDQSSIREILTRVCTASELWNREPSRFGQLMGESIALLINFESKQDAYVRGLERENAALTAEVERLEKCLEDGDYYPCEECLGVWSCDDLTDVSGDNFCPNCVDEARRKDAEEAKAEADIDSEYRRLRSAS